MLEVANALLQAERRAAKHSLGIYDAVNRP